MDEIRPRPASSAAAVAAMLQPALPLLAAMSFVAAGFLLATAFAGA